MKKKFRTFFHASSPTLKDKLEYRRGAQGREDWGSSNGSSLCTLFKNAMKLMFTEFLFTPFKNDHW